MIGFGIPRIIASMPPRLINLPNRQYWLAPEHLAETMAFLNAYFAWFGCAVFLIMILTFDYAIHSNLHPDRRPDVSRMWYILAGFFGFHGCLARSDVRAIREAAAGRFIGDYDLRRISLLMSIIVLFPSACRQAPRNSSPLNIDTYMASLAAQAVERARSGYGVTLDYSSDSVKDVEKLLATKYELKQTHAMTEKELADAADLWGAYIREVMKRMHAAHWARDSVAGGKDALALVFNDSGEESFPYAWVYHRLMNGEEDNVWVKFHFITQPGGLKQYFPPKKKLSSETPK